MTHVYILFSFSDLVPFLIYLFDAIFVIAMRIWLRNSPSTQPTAILLKFYVTELSDRILDHILSRLLVTQPAAEMAYVVIY